VDVVVKIDKFGRIHLPKAVRQEAGAEVFVVRAKHKEIRLSAVPTLDEMFGSMPEIDMVKFRKQREEDRRE